VLLFFVGFCLVFGVLLALLVILVWRHWLGYKNILDRLDWSLPCRYFKKQAHSCQDDLDNVFCYLAMTRYPPSIWVLELKFWMGLFVFAVFL